MSEHLKDKTPGVYCDPIPVTYNDKEYKVDCYCALAELTKNDDYGSFGTICHEYTHCFGFPDFYYGSKSYLGAWELMDYGNYNGNGYCPAGYSAYERWLMGWLTPTELTSATTVTDMPALNDKPQSTTSSATMASKTNTTWWRTASRKDGTPIFPAKASLYSISTMIRPYGSA